MTGVAIYDSSYSASHPWQVEGGTSAASPIIAATYALAGGPGAGVTAASNLYMHSAGLNDVVGGSNAVYYSCSVAYLCNGVAGYDGPTGLGTPHGAGAFSSKGTPGTYHAITPTRVLDTRNGTGGLSGPFTNHAARAFTVSGVPSWCHSCNRQPDRDRADVERLSLHRSCRCRTTRPARLSTSR